MKVTLLQTDIEWENQQKNISNAQSMIEQAEPSDLYVMPEMWTTGFTMQPQALPDDKGVTWMKQTALPRRYTALTMTKNSVFVSVMSK